MSTVTASVDQAPLRMPRAGTSFAWLRERGMGASILVAAISTVFGVVLIATTDFLAAMLRADPYIGDSGTLAFILGFLTLLLVALAVYVAGIVTANTFATVVAGRSRQIALLRLIGASARSQRARVASQGLIVGVLGAVIGTVLGIVVSAAGAQIAIVRLGLDAVPVAPVTLSMLLPAVIVALTTWLAAWIGSRRVLTVTPLQAVSGSVPLATDEVVARRGRHAVAGILFALGAAALAAGILLGLVSPLGVVVAFVGGALSFTGITMAAPLVMPPALRLVGRAFGRSAPARLAVQNAYRNPERSARTSIGIVIGVTLVTMFAVAIESVKAVLTANAGGELDPELASIMDTFAAIMMGLVAISAVIAGVGLVNLLTLGIIQRTRELGLLRALGVSIAQIRRMVLLEAVHVTVTATVLGVLLGIAYGWAGAQSLLGSVPTNPDGVTPAGIVWPAVPLGPLLVIVAATAILTVAASVTPTRLATRVAPVAALSE
ncbi:FtsX-like permease family protein [Microbacterium sp. F2]|uniref:FtsX-like permease family protein n=1 Tax=Microbacterium sp. F2 TaxID=3422228 RepID=UPI003FD32593